MLFDEVEKKYPAQFDNFWNHPEKYVPVDGESFNDLRIKLGKALLNIAKQNSGKDVLVVAHGIVIKALYTYFRNQPIAEIAQSLHALRLSVRNSIQPAGLGCNEMERHRPL